MTPIQTIEGSPSFTIASITTTSNTLEPIPTHILLSLNLQQHRMSIRAGNQTDADCSSDGLCESALVDRTETGLGTGLDAAHLCDVVGQDGDVLLNCRGY